MFFFYSFKIKSPIVHKRCGYRNRKISGCIRVWYDSNTFSKENQRKTDTFSAENQETFHHVDEEKQPESMETVGFFACFEIGLDGGKEYL